MVCIAEIAAIFKNNSSELISLLFDEIDYSFGSKNFSKQIWHWRYGCSNL